MSDSYQNTKAYAALATGIPSAIIFGFSLTYQPNNIIDWIGTIVFSAIFFIGLGYFIYIHKDDYKDCQKCNLPRRMHFPSSMFALKFHGCTLTEEEI